MAGKEGADGTVVVPFVRAMVTRGFDVMTCDVLPTEVPVLKVMYGDDSVQVDEAAEPGDVQVDASAEMELARLQRKYRSKDDDGDAVRFAYPGGARELKAFGFVPGGPVEERAQADIKVRKPTAKK